VNSLAERNKPAVSNQKKSVDESINRILNEGELSRPGVDFFFIIESKRFVRIRFADILSIEASGSYLNLQTRNTKYIIVGSMAKLEKRLPPTIFCRVHRSWIIPIDGVSVINKKRVMVNDSWFPLGNIYRKRLVKQLLPYVFNRRFLAELE
jgi:two-component system LytT family response regulator